MSGPNDRCAYVFSADVGADTCYTPRSEHGKMMHAFVESSPPPPAENARAGADETAVHEIAQRLWLELLNDGGDKIDFSMIEGAIRLGIAAGRARGIEEGLSRCVGIANERAEQCRVSMATYIERGMDGSWQHYSALGGRLSAQAIADVIAKETP